MNLQGIPDISAGKHKCRNCGTVTNGRRFCTTSCAAQAKTQELRNEAPVRRLDGRIEYVVVPRVGVRAERVLTIESDPLPARTCGDLLRRVLGFLRSRPPFMSASTARRHATLLRELLDPRNPEAGLGASEPVDQLGWVARHWLDTFLEPGRSGLQASYALDALELLRLVAYGQPGYGRELTIRGLLPKGEDAARTFRWLDTPQFRNEITESFVRGTVVQAVLPHGLAETPASASMPAGSLVTLCLQRCHLSEPVPFDLVDVELESADDAPFEWTRFRFDAHIFMTPTDDGGRRAWHPGQPLGPERWGSVGAYKDGVDLRVKVPGTWITQEVDVGAAFDLSTARARPLPEWASEG